MISPAFLFNLFSENGTMFFTGVPDSLLKNFCAYVTDTVPGNNHIIAANEGSATALAGGHHLATGKIPLVYMQNSGLGNAVNPLLSLVDPDVYSIPMVFLIGWRGEPGVHDEPQHIKQGKVTLELLETMGIPHTVLANDEHTVSQQIRACYDSIKKTSGPYALVVRKELFDQYKLRSAQKDISSLSRERAIEIITSTLPRDNIYISTTGMISRELYELRVNSGESHEKDFLTVGSMGHANQIALSVALSHPDRRIVCLDGDGAVLMHMGALATIGTSKAENLVHIVLNNGAHDSVGGQPTIASKIDLPAIAKACGYAFACTVDSPETLSTIISNTNSGPALIEVRVAKGARPDLGRPRETPIENKTALMSFLEKGKK